MVSSIIEVGNFSISLGGRRILQDVSLSVGAGDYVSIVGENGAGKTTLLKCIIRIHKGGTGSIAVDGAPISGYRQSDLAKVVSYVPQAGGRVVHAFSVHDFVMMGRYPYVSAFSAPTPSDNKAVEEALSVTETADLANRSLGTLSGGERQKVFIAAAIAQEAKVLLLDEPTTFLDPRHQAEVHTLLGHLNMDHGVTIVSVTHDINSAALTSQQVIALKRGIVVFDGASEDFMSESVLQATYGKPFSFLAHPETGQRIVAPEAPR